MEVIMKNVLKVIIFASALVGVQNTVNAAASVKDTLAIVTTVNKQITDFGTLDLATLVSAKESVDSVIATVNSISGNDNLKVALKLKIWVEMTKVLASKTAELEAENLALLGGIGGGDMGNFAAVSAKVDSLESAFIAATTRFSEQYVLNQAIKPVASDAAGAPAAGFSRKPSRSTKP
jgi:hypothetical protein